MANPGLAYVRVLGPRAESPEVLTGLLGASVTNLAFDGPDRRTVFCTESTHRTILRAEMSVACTAPHRTALHCTAIPQPAATGPDTHPFKVFVSSRCAEPGQ